MSYLRISVFCMGFWTSKLFLEGSELGKGSLLSK